MKKNKLENYNNFKRRIYLENRVTDILNYNAKNNSILKNLRNAENDYFGKLYSTLNKNQQKMLYTYIDSALQRNTCELMLVIEQMLKDLA